MRKMGVGVSLLWSMYVGVGGKKQLIWLQLSYEPLLDV